MSITSFDTQDIIKWYSEQNKLLGSDPTLYGRLFPEEPTEYCEGRTVQQSESVQVSTLLTKNQSVTTKFSLGYEASSANGNIASVTILANDIVVGNYTYNAPNIEDTKLVNLTAVGEVTEVTLQIIAVDGEGKSNSVTLPVKLTIADTDKPVLDNTATKVVALGTG